MRVGCFHGWVFILGFERSIPVAVIDSVLHRALAPSKGIA